MGACKGSALDPIRSHFVLPPQLAPLVMNTVEVPSPPGRRRGRPRPSIDTDDLRTLRLNIDLNAFELAQLQESAATASLPVRRWARRTLLGMRTPAARPVELRKLWGSSSTLQSNLNQVAARLGEMSLAAELNQEAALEQLGELLSLYPALYELVRTMRLELVSMRGNS